MNTGNGNMDFLADANYIYSDYNYFNPSVDGTTTIEVATPGTGSQNLIRFVQSNTVQGAISVNGGTVTYGAFTGAHYAWTNDELEIGMVVSMTGDNKRRDQDDMDAEPFYGVTPTTEANDKKVLGVFIGKEGDAFTFETPYLIAAVGNGTMWVNDEGGNIDIGDDLVSSHLGGHAMKDTGEWAESNVIARASDRVDWSKETRVVHGHKVKKISVLFGAYTKLNATGLAQALDGGGLVTEDVAFKGLVTFASKVRFEGQIRTSGDTAGTLTIPAGQTRAAVVFTKPYAQPPRITLGAYDFARTKVESKTVNGFVVEIAEPAGQDMQVDWHALEAP
jgi:hypothetical protein